MADSSGCPCRSTMMICPRCAVDILKKSKVCHICKEDEPDLIKCDRCNRFTCRYDRKTCTKCVTFLCKQCRQVSSYCEYHDMKITFRCGIIEIKRMFCDICKKRNIDPQQCQKCDRHICYECIVLTKKKGYIVKKCRQCSR